MQSTKELLTNIQILSMLYLVTVLSKKLFKDRFSLFENFFL